MEGWRRGPPHLRQLLLRDGSLLLPLPRRLRAAPRVQQLRQQRHVAQPPQHTQLAHVGHQRGQRDQPQPQRPGGGPAAMGRAPALALGGDAGSQNEGQGLEVGCGRVCSVWAI